MASPKKEGPSEEPRGEAGARAGRPGAAAIYCSLAGMINCARGWCQARFENCRVPGCGRPVKEGLFVELPVIGAAYFLADCQGAGCQRAGGEGIDVDPGQSFPEVAG